MSSDAKVSEKRSVKASGIKFSSISCRMNYGQETISYSLPLSIQVHAVTDLQTVTVEQKARQYTHQ